MNDIMRRFLQGHVPWLFIAMAVGLMLRWYKLSGDLYADEIWITESVKLPFDAFLREVMDDWVHPPLFFFIVRGLGLLFGFHELSGRLVALVAGVLSIPLIAWIGSLSHSRKVGVIAAILLAISPIHIWHSQYGRHYSLFVFFVLLSTATFMKVWQDPRSRLWSSLYVLSSVVLVYTHNFGWLLILCQNVAFILFRFTTVKHWAALQVILGVLFLPWPVTVAPVVLAAQSSGGALIPHIVWLTPPGLLVPIRTIREFNGPIHLRFADLTGLVVFTGLVGLSLKSIIGRQRQWRLVLFLVLTILVPFVLVFIVSRTVQPMWIPRVMMISLPAYYVLIAVGTQQIRNFKASIVLPSVAVFWLVIAVISYMNRPHRIPFEEIASYLRQNTTQATPILVSNYYLMNPLYRYYDGEGILYQLEDDNLSVVPESHKIRDLGSLPDTVNAATRILLVTYGAYDAKREAVRREMAGNYRLVSEKTFIGEGEDWSNDKRLATVIIYQLGTGSV